MSNPFQVVRDFEAELCAYTGAQFAVAVNSCTSALILAVAWRLRHGYARHLESFMRPGVIYESTYTPMIEKEMSKGRRRIRIPKRTYVSVPMSIIHAGGFPEFRDEDWSGAYRLEPYEIWDSARWFTSNLFGTLTKGEPGFVCVSFHASKTLGLEQGGAILHNVPEADPWLRRMRFDGRTEGVAPKDDDFKEIGFHCYMSPSVAAQGLLRLYSLPKHNAPLPNDPYPDLSQLDIFK